MIAWIKSLFCSHDLVFIRNIYGDEINMRDGARSVWQCKKCNTYKYGKYLAYTFYDNDDFVSNK